MSPGSRRLYSWDVDSRRAGGVTDSAVLAAVRVYDELVRARAGSEGTVRRVALGMAYSPYDDRGEIIRARLNADGAVSWEVK